MAVARESTRHAYQLRVQLRGVSPPIWRRILIACNATLVDLHAVIQAAMGWEDIHLHQFTIRGQCYGVPLAGAVSLHAGTTDLRLSDFGLRVHERLGYAYDFHSEWWHDIRVEKVLSESIKNPVDGGLAVEG